MYLFILCFTVIYKEYTQFIYLKNKNNIND